MDYAIELYSHGDISYDIPPRSLFIYDDNRFFSKLYVTFKFIGLVVYSTTLTTCERPDFFMIMIGFMFSSTLNSLRYEYEHYRRYGTMFSSLDEFNTWKNDLWPKSRMLFSGIELAIKLGYFIKTFPPEFNFITPCEVGQSIFNIHILALFVLYIFAGTFSMCIFSSVYCFDHSRRTTEIEPANEMGDTGSLPAHIPVAAVVLSQTPNEECCICLDVDDVQTWVILPCGHKFHGSCISRWLPVHYTCPVCRLHIT